MSTQKWIIVISIILLLAIVGTIIVSLPRPGSTVEIVQDGTVLYIIDLSKEYLPRKITIDYNGQSNTISIEHNRICVSEATCPDHVCIKTGWIPRGAEPIVCLPNHLVIQTVSSDSEFDIAVH